MYYSRENMKTEYYCIVILLENIVNSTLIRIIMPETAARCNCPFTE